MGYEMALAFRYRQQEQMHLMHNPVMPSCDKSSWTSILCTILLWRIVRYDAVKQPHINRCFSLHVNEWQLGATKVLRVCTNLCVIRYRNMKHIAPYIYKKPPQFCHVISEQGFTQHLLNFLSSMIGSPLSNLCERSACVKWLVLLCIRLNIGGSSIAFQFLFPFQGLHGPLPGWYRQQHESSTCPVPPGQEQDQQTTQPGHHDGSQWSPWPPELFSSDRWPGQWWPPPWSIGFGDAGSTLRLLLLCKQHPTHAHHVGRRRTSCQEAAAKRQWPLRPGEPEQLPRQQRRNEPHKLCCGAPGSHRRDPCGG